MNRLLIIGNLTNDPDSYTTAKGTPMTVFTVAVNRKGAGAPEADFFKVVAYNGLADNCRTYLHKGKKVSVLGDVHLNTYTGKDGKSRSTMDVTALEVEFLSPMETPAESPKNTVKTQTPKTDAQSGMVVVNDDDELPF